MLSLRAFSFSLRRFSTTVTSALDNSFPKENSLEQCVGSGTGEYIEQNHEIRHSMTEKKSDKITEKCGRYALLLCYHGKNYWGLQYNINGPTIEDELFKALQKSGNFLETMGRPGGHGILSQGYTRTSRTDSGVSALRQVVALDLPLTVKVDEINQYLPPDIRILGIKRTTKGFDGQKWCQSRSYSYIMPSYAFCHHRILKEPRINYRIDADTLTMANEIFQEYKGTHRFHNYTERRDFYDARSLRRIHEAYISDAFLIGDMEMVQMHIQGNSFMLHQIRRMVGMTIALMRGRVHFSFLHKTLNSLSMPTPTAPALGLMLEKQDFDAYNRKFGCVREPLVWDEYDNEVEKFKCERILPDIVAREIEENVMNRFLDFKLMRHTFKGDPASSRLKTIKNWHEIDVEQYLKDEELQKSNKSQES